MKLSKSKYCEIWQCPKIAWMKKYRAEEEVIDDSARQRMESGRIVGEYARHLFGENFIDVTVTDTDGQSLNLPAMVTNTREAMESGAETICEAAFAYNNMYCAVDILRKENGGYVIYEVKSATEENPIYYADVAYQKYVLGHCGVNVTGSHLVYLNNEYVFDGTLRLNELFCISDDLDTTEEESKIEDVIASAEEIIDTDSEPDIDLNIGCKKPYDCSFFAYCSRNLPKPSVFNLYRQSFSKKLDYYYQNKISYFDLVNEPTIKSKINRMQIDHIINKTEITINKKEISKFLEQMTFPLYFVDFETMQPVIPEFIGTKPYAQIPFQYSLHICTDYDESHMIHREFLAESGTDPRRAFAESICRDIPMDVNSVVYNKAFEQTRLKELAETFPDLSEHLINIGDHIIDLLVPFSQGNLYTTEMGGSFSIKSVLPALYPDDPKLNYHNLDGVHNGTEAMTVFPKICSMSPEEQAKTRHNLLKYCELDTYAMVKVWQYLLKSVR
jgi:hypothetical protein